MLKAKDFRAYAREALKGRWLKAGAASLVAGLLGASIGVGNYATSFSSAFNSESDISVSNITATSQIPASFFATIMGVALIFLIWGIINLIIGGATTLGYAKYNLAIVDDKDPEFKEIFSQYHRLGTGFGMQFFRALFTFLWSLLLLIPGIIACYRYYMTPFILVENPEMTAREAIAESKELMKGNKWRLFCLELSFIGWELLAVLIMWIVMMVTIFPVILTGSESAIIGLIVVMFIEIIVFIVALELILSPYITAAIAVFYREIKDGKYSNPHIEGSVEEYTYESPVEEPVVDTQPVAEQWKMTEE